MWIRLIAICFVLNFLKAESEQKFVIKRSIKVCPRPLPCTSNPDAYIKVNFRLFTQKQPTEATQLLTNFYDSLRDSSFDPTKPTKLLVHGFLNGHDSFINERLRPAYLRNHDVNVIVASWGSGAKTPCYMRAVEGLQKVGASIGEFLDFLLGDDSLAWKKLTIVGFSLGAHVAGFAGKHATMGRVGTIVGLDPGLCFQKCSRCCEF